jgi:hypothetical protein
MAGFVETWKAISAALGRSDRWCRYMAARAERPLPAFKVGGIVRLNLDDLQQWLEEEKTAPGGTNYHFKNPASAMAERQRRGTSVAAALGAVASPEALGG